jgi:hypothetical protein
MKTAFVIFDRMTSLDFVGFYDPVTRLESMKVMDDFEWRTFEELLASTDADLAAIARRLRSFLISYSAASA